MFCLQFITVLFYICLWDLRITACNKMQSYRNIMGSIYDSNSYDKRILPSNTSSPVIINATLYFHGVISVKEAERKMVTFGAISLWWIDPRLMWSPSSYGGISLIHIPQNDVWKPDFILQNGFQTCQSAGENTNFVRIDYDGTVVWDTLQVFESRCLIDITFFPFDIQRCSLIFGVWSYESADVDIVSNSKDLSAIQSGSHFQEHSLWTVRDTEVKVDNKTVFENKDNIYTRASA